MSYNTIMNVNQLYEARYLEHLIHYHKKIILRINSLLLAVLTKLIVVGSYKFVTVFNKELVKDCLISPTSLTMPGKCKSRSSRPELKTYTKRG